jgi:hypothetical protein
LRKPVVSAWERRRSEFNHDWLNRYLLRFRAFIDRLADEPVDAARVEEFIRNDVPAWLAKREQALALALGFTEEMSPRTLLEGPGRPPLDGGARVWLPEVVHRLWLNRNPVVAWVEEAVAAVRQADEAHEELVGFLGRARIPGARELRSLEPGFARLLAALDRVSSAFSKFPHEVRVT